MVIRVFRSSSISIVALCYLGLVSGKLASMERMWMSC